MIVPTEPSSVRITCKFHFSSHLEWFQIESPTLLVHILVTHIILWCHRFAILQKLTRRIFEYMEEWANREVSILSRWISREASFDSTVTCIWSSVGWSNRIIAQIPTTTKTWTCTFVRIKARLMIFESTLSPISEPDLWRYIGEVYYPKSSNTPFPLSSSSPSVTKKDTK